MKKNIFLIYMLMPVFLSPVYADNTVNVSIVGDLMLTQSAVVKGIKEHGYTYPFREVKDYLSLSDISIGNLEFSISKRGKAVNKKWTFRADPSIIESLEYSGIDVFGIANNHSCDYGHEAFLDTMDFLVKSSFSVVGGGLDLSEAQKGIVVEKKGIKIGIVAMGCILPESFYSTLKSPGILSGNPDNIIKSIESVRDRSDIVIAIFHWGGELRYYPKQYQRDYAKLAINKGADIVVGHHPHVLQGIEIYKSKPILYSLGNFVSSSARPETKESVICNFEVIKSSKTGTSKINRLILKPVYINNGQPKFANKSDSSEIFKLLSNISLEFNTGLAFDDAKLDILVSTNTKTNLSRQSGLRQNNEIIIDKKKLKLKVINSSGTVLAEYPVSLGKQYGDKLSQNDKRTPEGPLRILRIQESIDWKYNFHDGKGYIAESYGPWYFATSSPWKNTGICGSISERLIGKRNTEGFIRLKNRDLIDLKKHIKVETKITVSKD